MITKQEFLNRLAYELGNMSEEAKKEILTDFYEHFDIAEQSGKTEEETCRMLGDPKEIAADFYGRENGGEWNDKSNNGRNNDNHVFTEYAKKDYKGDIRDALKEAGDAVRTALNSVPFIRDLNKKRRHDDEPHTYISQYPAADIETLIVELISSDVDFVPYKNDSNNQAMLYIDIDSDDWRYFKTTYNAPDKSLVLTEARNANTDITIKIPPIVELIVKTASGDVDIQKDLTATSLEVRTASGDVDVREAALVNLTASTGSGDVDITGCACVKTSISTGSGEIDLLNCASTTFNLSAGSGEITADKCAGELKAGTGSGDITVLNHNGNIRAGAGSGDIEIKTDELLGNETYSTGSGDISIVCNVLRNDIRISSGSGDIDFTAHEVNGNITVKSSSGDIDIALAAGNSVRFETSANSRGSDINIKYQSPEQPRYNVLLETHSGDIDVATKR
ncbi:MAG: DUF4097 family beta strand repeat-containing protein [Defluviitaleaceae bacterium]|nr:DUF4097 family beta strand repeat-containing protein [Defluviitaleaceae bacterium]